MNNPTNTTPDNMTLRDWFAGQALSGMSGVKIERAFSPQEVESGFVDRWAASAARTAYLYADAMLQARTTHE